MDRKEKVFSLILSFFLLLYIQFTIVSVTATTATKDQFRSRVLSEIPMTRPGVCSHVRSSVQEQLDGTKDICADIIGRKWRNNTREEESACPMIIVWVPKTTGFTEFAKVSEQCEVKDGFSLAIFCYALQQLPFEVKPIFIPFVDKNGDGTSYDDLVKHIAGKTCQAVAADTTIRSNRAQYVDFTIPYMSSEVYVLVHASQQWNQTLLTLLKPFSWRLWLIIIGACIFIGLAIAILEYRAGNPEFNIPFYRKLILVIWFPVSTFYFHEGRILNGCSKVVLIMWLSMIFIVLQIFTASLSSWLTINQLHAKFPKQYENVGYRNGSFVGNFTVENYGWSAEKLRALSTVEEYKQALSNGSVNAIFDELPYIDLFLAHYKSNYMKIGPMNEEPGIAFAFPLGSALVANFSRAVIKVIESRNMTEMKKNYLGFSPPDQSDQSQTVQALPQSLDYHSFIGLFVFMGTVTIGAVIWSEIYLLRHGQARIVPLPSAH